MSDLLQELHSIATEFYKMHMRQIAGDYDYIVAWLRSPAWTKNGEHLKPNPAGKNTYDEYSHHCPIPYSAGIELFNFCSNNDAADGLLKYTREIILSLYEEYTSEEEKTALDAYVEYTDDLITLLTGESPSPPEPPVPTMGLAIGGVLTATSDEVVEVETPYQLENGRIAFTGELTDNVIPESGVVEEYATPIIILSGVRYSGGNFATDFITSWGAYNLAPTTQADADALTDLGITLQYAGTYGPYGSVLWDENYIFEPVAVYTDIDGTNEYTEVDVGGLSCQINFSAGNSVAMYSRNDYWGSQVMTWRCRITKK
jgi:hypothetical protein